MPRVGRLAGTLTVAACLGLALAGMPTTPAAGQQDADPAGSVRVTITDLTGVLGPGTLPAPTDVNPVLPDTPDELRLRMLVENDGDVALDALRVVVEVHPPAETRGELRRALEGTLGPDPLHVHTSEEIAGGGGLAPGAVAGVTDEFVSEEIDWPDGPGGVHPVRISVIRGTTVLDEAVTAVVWLGSAPESPLLTSMVWPLGAAPWRTTGGAYPDAAGREIRPGGRLDTLLTAVETVAGAPVVLAPAAHLLEDLSDRSDGFDAITRQEAGSLETRPVAADNEDAELARRTLQRIRELAATQTHAPVSGAYADADLAAISGDGAIAELGGVAAAEGRRRVQLQLGTGVDAGVHLVDGPISPAVLDLLPANTVVLPSRATVIPPLDEDPSLDEPVRALRAPSGRVLTALLADPYLEDAFAAARHRAGPLVTAQRILAETAMAYFDAPGVTDRALVLLPPPTWDPSPQAATMLLRSLKTATWVDLTSPGRIASDARRSRASLELAPPEDGPFRPELVRSITQATAGLRSLEAALPDPDTRVQGRELQALADDVLRSTSRWYRGDTTGEADALVRDVQRAIDTSLGSIEVSSGTVTLTSDTGQIPVTLQRTRGGPIRVVVSVESQGRLLWPEGRTAPVLELPEDGSQTVSFRTQALSTGSFPVTVRVTDPSGTTVIARTTLSVRSTALSGVALSGTGLLVAILLLFGAFRRRERPTRKLTSVDRS